MMAEGLRFECQPGCTACCEQKGLVYLTEGDLARAAAFVGMTAKAFERKYVYHTRNRIRLRVPTATFWKGAGVRSIRRNQANAGFFRSDRSWWKAGASGRRRRGTARGWGRGR